MGQPKEARLTAELAQQICERTASAMVLEGSIASLGSQYVMGLHARNCNTGNTVDQQQVQVARREDVLNALSQVARKLRTQVGESRATVEKHSTPLAEATTPSLEALKAYSTGVKAALSGDSPRPYPFSAARLKSILNSRWRTPVWDWLTAVLESRCCQPRARRVPGNCGIASVSRERFFIDFTYDRQVAGNLEQAYQTLELWLRTYPRSEQPGPLGFLAGLSTHGTGRYERAIDASQQSIAKEPGLALPYASLAYELSPHGPFRRSGEHTATRLRAQAGNARSSGHPIQHRAAEGRPGADGPGSRSGQGQAGGGTLDGSRGGSRSGSFRPAASGPAVIEPGRGSGPARGGTRGGSELPGRTSGVGSRVRECCRREKERHGGAGAFERPGCPIRRRPCPGSFGRLLSIATACRRSGKALPGRYVRQIYLRTGSSRVIRTGAREARRQRGAAAHRSAL